MPQDVNNILIGAGRLRIVIGDNLLELGYTARGVTFDFDRAYLEGSQINALGPTLIKKVGEQLLVRIMLLESTLNNLKVAWGGYGSPIVPQPGLTGTGTGISFGGQPLQEEGMLWIEGPGPNCATRNIYVWKVVSFETGEMVIGKDNVANIPVIFKALEDMGRIAGQRLFEVYDDPEIEWSGPALG